jgi:hypothetical protein
MKGTKGREDSSRRRGRSRRTEVEPEERRRRSLIPTKRRKSVRVTLDVGVRIVVRVLAAANVGRDSCSKGEDEEEGGLSDVDDDRHSNLLERSLESSKESEFVGEYERGDCKVRRVRSLGPEERSRECLRIRVPCNRASIVMKSSRPVRKETPTSHFF